MASSSDQATRHASAALPAAPSASSIPPAPPLPPQRTAQAPTRSAFARFVQPFSGYGSSRPATVAPAGGRDGGGGKGAAVYAPKAPGFNPHAPQHTSFTTKGASEIAAIDINHERTHAVLAGREILETISVVRTACDTDTNIRAAIINKDRDNATRHRDNLDIHDVKWSHGQYSSTIATAATNGKVVIYDLNRPGVEVARLHEHHRQVHRVAFNPHHGALLLSGSQDATVRLWDLRDMRSDMMTLRSHNRYMGQSDGVRDIRWSPTDGLEFAFGTDGGVVLDWDSRYTKSAKLKINAHHGPCTAVDWHPDGKHIASGGQDNNLMVWDVSSVQRRQKPSWTLRTPYPIANARWRPPCFSGDDRGRGSWQCAQIMTSYERNFPTLNLWDFRRPHMPFREMWPSETTAPTDMLWRSADLLWCVGRTGVFKQIDVKFTAKTIDRRPLTAFAISHTGEMMIFSQKRIRPRGSGFDAPQIFTTRRASQTMLQESPLARSGADDSIDDSFLSSSHQKHHERTLSNRSTKSIGGTPPSLQEVGIAKLSDTLKDNKHAYQPRQVAARGFLPGHPNQQHFCYLAQKYKITTLPDNPTVDDFLAVNRVFEQNAKYAEKTSNNRLAQTWRLFGGVLQRELIQRADHNKKRRLGLVKAELDATLVLPKVFESTRERFEKKRLSVRQKSEGAGVKTTNTLKVEESSSNVPTPIARPIQSSSYEFADKRIPNLEQDEQLSLPPAVMTRVAGEGLLSNTIMAAPEQSDNLRPMFDGPRWYSSASDLNERKAMMSNYRVPPKMPLDFEVPKALTSSAIDIPPPLDRHNSDESFAMFSASLDSKGGVSMPASYTSQRSQKQSMGSIPEHRMSHYPGTFPADSDDAPSSTPAVTESSQSCSSKDDIFNTEYASLQLSESPLGSRDASLLRYCSNEYNLDASGTIVPEEVTIRLGKPANSSLVVENANISKKIQPPSKGAKARPNLTQSTTTKLTADDLEFIPYIVEDFTETQWLIKGSGYPLTVGKMLEELFMHVNGPLADVQHMFHLVAILRPFLPGSIASSKPVHALHGQVRLNEAAEELQKYADFCLNTVNLTPDDTAALLADPLAHLVRFGVPLRTAELLFKTYEQQLHASKLFVPLVELRRIAAGAFATYRETQLANSQVGETCLHCKKPIRKQRGKCSNCHKGHDECPVCWQQFSPFVVTKRARREKETRDMAVMSINGYEEEDMSIFETFPELPLLWQTCLSCGHGCHSACMSSLQGNVKTAGRCPAVGCDCACLPGPFRDQVIREREEEIAHKSAGSVRKDNRRISESSAVKGARGILEEAKKVRVVEPGK